MMKLNSLKQRPGIIALKYAWKKNFPLVIILL